MKGKTQMFSPKNMLTAICLAAMTAAICLSFVHNADAQKNRTRIQIKKTAPAPAAAPAATPTPNPASAVNAIEPKEEKSAIGTVVEEKLAVIRADPDLYSAPLQRLTRGRVVSIIRSTVKDGIMFYLVTASVSGTEKQGWLQAEAVTTTIRKGDDERLVKLIQASKDFPQIERTIIFLETFPDSAFRPAILLLQGDLLEDIAEKLSLDANKRLDKAEMAATGAPLQTFFLNYNGLDRYRKLGIVFLFNSNTKYFHYGGEYWKEILQRFPKSNEAAEAKKRLESLQEKMAQIK
jgi:hypothetical protein